MPRSLKSLEDCPTHRTKLTTYEKVKRARRQQYEWKRRLEEKNSFNRDQGIASKIEVKPTKWGLKRNMKEASKREV